MSRKNLAKKNQQDRDIFWAEKLKTIIIEKARDKAILDWTTGTTVLEIIYKFIDAPVNIWSILDNWADLAVEQDVFKKVLNTERIIKDVLNDYFEFNTEVQKVVCFIKTFFMSKLYEESQKK